MAWSDAARAAAAEMRRARAKGRPWRRPWVSATVTSGTAEEVQMWTENNPNQHGIKMIRSGKSFKVFVHPGRVARIARFMSQDYDRETGLEVVHPSTKRAMRNLAAKLAAKKR